MGNESPHSPNGMLVAWLIGFLDEKRMLMKGVSSLTRALLPPTCTYARAGTGVKGGAVNLLQCKNGSFVSEKITRGSCAQKYLFTARNWGKVLFQGSDVPCSKVSKFPVLQKRTSLT